MTTSPFYSQVAYYHGVVGGAQAQHARRPDRGQLHPEPRQDRPVGDRGQSQGRQRPRAGGEGVQGLRERRNPLEVPSTATTIPARAEVLGPAEEERHLQPVGPEFLRQRCHRTVDGRDVAAVFGGEQGDQTLLQPPGPLPEPRVGEQMEEDIRLFSAAGTCTSRPGPWEASRMIRFRTRSGQLAVGLQHRRVAPLSIVT